MPDTIRLRSSGQLSAGRYRSAGRGGRLSVDFRGELYRGKAADQMIEVGGRMHHRGNDLENQPTQREPGAKPMPHLGARDHCSYCRLPPKKHERSGWLTPGH